MPSKTSIAAKTLHLWSRTLWLKTAWTLTGRTDRGPSHLYQSSTHQGIAVPGYLLLEERCFATCQDVFNTGRFFCTARSRPMRTDCVMQNPTTIVLSA
jgi:hypothetical protein